MEKLINTRLSSCKYRRSRIFPADFCGFVCRQKPQIRNLFRLSARSSSTEKPRDFALFIARTGFKISTFCLIVVDSPAPRGLFPSRYEFRIHKLVTLLLRHNPGDAKERISIAKSPTASIRIRALYRDDQWMRNWMLEGEQGKKLLTVGTGRKR